MPSSYESPREEFFRGLDTSELNTDEAFLNTTTAYNVPFVNIFLYTRNENCYGCPYERRGYVSPQTGLVLKLSTHHRWFFRLRSDGVDDLVSQYDTFDPDEICSFDGIKLGEFGIYDLRHANGTCTFTEALEPVNAYLALLWCTLIMLGLGFVYRLLLKDFGRLLRKWFKDRGIILFKALEGKGEKEPGERQKKRLKSLDTFRGISMAILIFVNDGGGGYFFFDHATWNGLYLADFAFPWFMWIMGFCIPMSIKSMAKKKTPLKVSLFDITKRSIKLFILGFFWINIGERKEASFSSR